MAIPGFQDFMLPLLKAASDGDVHRTRDLFPALAGGFGMTAAEREEKLASGVQRVYENRIFWAASYIRKAGLLAGPKKGHIQITDAGKNLLAQSPDKITIALLKQYPSFNDFLKGRPGDEDGSIAALVSVPISSSTPEEVLEATWAGLRQDLGQDLLVKIKECSPSFFERLVVDLLVRMGYGGSIADAGKTLGKSGDEGLDGVIKEDKLGLDLVYIQAKRWEGVVGRPVVQGFAGSLDGAKARKGVMLTTSSFSGEAHQYVKNIEKRIVLIDGRNLVALMMDHGVGVATAHNYTVQKIDMDYFEED